MEEKKSDSRLHVIISGRVQGVFFRMTSQQQALHYDLTGWVRNCRNGTVELLAEGDKNNLSKMLEWCHEGPAASHVTGVEKRWKDGSGEFTDFVIYPTTTHSGSF